MATPAQACETTASAFLDYGIDDGSDLIKATARGLQADDVAYEPTTGFFDRLETAFRLAFVRRADLPVVPEPVEDAIADARGATIHRLLGTDPDLRTDVVPTFYRLVARFACQYRPAYPDGGADIGFER